MNDDFHFFSFWLEIPFWANLVQKTKIVSLSWNFAPDLVEYSELCRKYLVFIFSVLDQKNPFWANLVKKIKIVSFSWNLVPRLIWICRIQWWYSLFLFLTYKYISFLDKFGPKIKNCLFKVRFDTKTNMQICKSQWSCLFCLF